MKQLSDCTLSVSCRDPQRSSVCILITVFLIVIIAIRPAEVSNYCSSLLNKVRNLIHPFYVGDCNHATVLHGLFPH